MQPALETCFHYRDAEPKARDRIDTQLRGAGWSVQNKDAIDFNEGEGQAVREYIVDAIGVTKSLKTASPSTNPRPPSSSSSATTS